MIKNIGLILTAIYLVLQGFADLGTPIPSIVLGLLAIAAGIFLLIGK